MENLHESGKLGSMQLQLHGNFIMKKVQRILWFRRYVDKMIVLAGESFCLANMGSGARRCLDNSGYKPGPILLPCEDPLTLVTSPCLSNGV